MKRINLIALGIFVAMIIAVFSIETETTRGIQSTVLSIFGFAHKVVAAVTTDEDMVDGVDLSPEAILARNSPEQLSEKYSILAREVAALRIVRSRYELVQQENAQLRASLDFKQGYSIPLKAARVIKRDASTWWSTLMIDKGLQDGMSIGQPVVAQTGALVGKITSTGTNSSTVLLLTDEQFQVAARVAGSQEKGIVMGKRAHLGISGTAPEVVLKYLSKDEAMGRQLMPKEIDGVAVKTVVYTLGNNNDQTLEIFPGGMEIGTVKSFSVKDLYGEAIIESTADFATLTDVFVIMPEETEFVPRAAEEFSIDPDSGTGPREAIPVPEPAAPEPIVEEEAPPAARPAVPE